MKRCCLSALSIGCILTLIGGASAQTENRTLCVFDPSGANGDLFQSMKDYRGAALSWGVNFSLKPYTDEKTLAEDFKAKQCDAALMTGTRIRQFHPFSGSLEAMGGLQSYEQIRSVIKSLSSPKAKSLMRQGAYEVAGILPGGAVYLLVRDRKIDTVQELAGRRIATLEYDKAAKTMVRQVGASMVAADVGTFAGMFNNGSVDAAYAPASAFKALELYKGIANKGGVIRYPLAQLTMQLLIHHTKLPEDFGIKSRRHAAQMFKASIKLAQKADQTIKAAYWIDIPAEDKKRYDEMFLEVRLRLRDQDKIYHPKALTLLRKVRCRTDPARAECAEKRE
jgi:hypothetical protein